MSPATAWVCFALGLLFMVAAAYLTILDRKLHRDCARYMREGEQAWDEAKLTLVQAMETHANTRRLIDAQQRALPLPPRRTLDA